MQNSCAKPSLQQPQNWLIMPPRVCKKWAVPSSFGTSAAKPTIGDKKKSRSAAKTKKSPTKREAGGD